MQAFGRQPQRLPDGTPVHYDRYRPEQTTLYRTAGDLGFARCAARRLFHRKISNSASNTRKASSAFLNSTSPSLPRSRRPNTRPSVTGNIASTATRGHAVVQRQRPRQIDDADAANKHVTRQPQAHQVADDHRPSQRRYAYHHAGQQTHRGAPLAFLALRHGQPQRHRVQHHGEQHHQRQHALQRGLGQRKRQRHG